jgi:putative hydrolase of the HAD superfamily
MKKYKHLFFDLDRTIWDFETSSSKAIENLFNKYNIPRKTNVSFDIFLKKYREINSMLWDLYRKDEIKREFLNIERFRLTLEAFGIDDALLAGDFANDYVSNPPDKPYLFDGAIEMLDALKPHYAMHIVTNGFDEVQRTKIRFSRLDHYFKTVVTSEEAGCKKPSPGIFRYALEKAHARPEESIMIGDDYKVDILGAKEVGIDQVYCNYTGQPNKNGVTHQVDSLFELKNIFLPS